MPTLSFLTPPRIEGIEMIDAHEAPDSALAASFADVARVNRYLGGTNAVLRALSTLISGQSTAFAPDRPLRILDIATGSADIPRAIVRAARRGRFGTPFAVEVVATDNHPKVVALAARLTPPDAYPEIAVCPADALALPFADGSFDIALCSMAFHHLGPANAICAMQEMERVSRVGFVVNDLLRDRIASALIWILTRFVRAHEFTRHDAPLSVLRAYTVAEYGAMAAAAGVPCAVRRVPIYRAVVVRDRFSDKR